MEKITMKRFAMMLVTLLAMTVGFVSAQTPKGGEFKTFAPYFSGTVNTAPGSSNLDYRLGVGLEINTKHLLLDANGNFSSANVANGAGHSGTLTAQGYYKLFGHVLAGGGADWVVNTGTFNAKQFINTARTSANPFVGGGFQLGRLRSIVTYQIPTAGNALPNERAFNISNELALTKRLRAVVPVSVTSYNNGIPARVTVTQVGGGLKFVF